MTVHCKDNVLFGLISQEREVTPGTQETLDEVRLGSRHGRRVIGNNLVVESEDLVIVRYNGIGGTLDRRYYQNEINEAKIKSHPSGLKDLLLGIKREYSWRPSSKERA